MRGSRVNFEGWAEDRRRWANEGREAREDHAFDDGDPRADRDQIGTLASVLVFSNEPKKREIALTLRRRCGPNLRSQKRDEGCQFELEGTSPWRTRRDLQQPRKGKGQHTIQRPRRRRGLSPTRPGRSASAHTFKVPSTSSRTELQ